MHLWASGSTALLRQIKHYHNCLPPLERPFLMKYKSPNKVFPSNLPCAFLLLPLLSATEWTALLTTDFVSAFCSLFFYPNNISLLVLLDAANCWLSSFAITSLAFWRSIYLSALALSYACYYCWVSLSSIENNSYCSSFAKSEIVSCSTFYLFVRLRLPKALISFLFYTLLHVCIVVMIF